MPLTDREREFMAAFIHEATTDPFTGPATKELHRRNIYYTDVSHLMTAYYRENVSGQEGFGCKYDLAPPPCPWKDLDTAGRRDHEVAVELERLAQRCTSNEESPLGGREGAFEHLSG
jgi:hypothetical protein